MYTAGYGTTHSMRWTCAVCVRAGVWLGSPHREDVLRVVHAVDADAVLERGAVGRRKEHQLQALGGGHAERLAHQCHAAQLLREHAARLGLQLAVVGLGRQLVP